MRDDILVICFCSEFDSSSNFYFSLFTISFILVTNMDSTDSSERSNFSSITKYDDALINLANARCGYKNSIVKYLTRINELELAKLKKITYKEIDPSFPEMVIRKFEPQSNQISKHYQNSAVLEDEIINQSKNLKNEINDLKKITQKLRQEKENAPPIL